MTKIIYRSTSILAGFAIFGACCASLAADRATPAAAAPPALVAMQEELDRSMTTLSKADPPVYFISYTLADRQDSDVSGSNGALLSSTEDRARWLEVQTAHRQLPTGRYAQVLETACRADQSRYHVRIDDDLARSATRSGARRTVSIVRLPRP